MKYIPSLILITLLSTITYPKPNSVVPHHPSTSSQKPYSFSKMVSEHKSAVIVGLCTIAVTGYYLWRKKQSPTSPTRVLHSSPKRVPSGNFDILQFNCAINNKQPTRISELLTGPPPVNPSIRIQSKTLLESTHHEKCLKAIAQHIFRYKKNKKQNKCSNCRKVITLDPKKPIGIFKCCHALYCSECQQEARECQQEARECTRRECANKESKQDRALLFSEKEQGDTR